MSYFQIIILSLLLSCGAGSGSDRTSSGDNTDSSSTDIPRVSEHVDVVFYNVENFFDTENDPKKEDDDFTPNGRNEWSDGRYEKKLKNLSRVIQSIDHGQGEAAIIGLAEVENRAVVEDLGNMIIPNGYDVVHSESPDHRGIDVALLYRKDMIQKLDEDFLSIDFSERGYTSRDILYFKGELMDQGIIHVLVNHWPSRRGGWQETEHRRIDAAKTLKKQVDKIKSDDKDAQIIILGDFNDYPDNKSLMQTLKASPKDNKRSGELVNLAYDLEMEDKGTYPYKGDWGMLDQGIVSDNLMDNKGLSIAKDGLEIHWKDFFMYYDKKYKEYKPDRTYGGPKYYGGYSDHLPIILHFKTN